MCKRTGYLRDAQDLYLAHIWRFLRDSASRVIDHPFPARQPSSRRAHHGLRLWPLTRGHCAGRITGTDCRMCTPLAGCDADSSTDTRVRARRSPQPHPDAGLPGSTLPHQPQISLGQRRRRWSALIAACSSECWPTSQGPAHRRTTAAETQRCMTSDEVTTAAV